MGAPDPITDVRPRLRRAAPAHRRGAARDDRARRLEGEPDGDHHDDDGQGAQRGAAHARWRTTPRSCSWARTSASSAASSASPTACRRTSARTASSTRRSASRRSSAPRSAWPMRGYRAVCRDPVRRLRLPGLRPDRLPGGQAAHALRGRLHDGAGDPHPLPGRHRRDRAPLREPGGLLRAHRRAARRVVLDAERRLLDDPAVDRLRRPDHLLRAEVPLLGEGRGRPRRAPGSGSSTRSCAAPAPT